MKKNLQLQYKKKFTIKYLPDKEDWKKFEQINKEIALNILFVTIRKEKQNPHIHQNINTSVIKCCL